MQHTTEPLESKVVLITGAAHRIGACMARTLHGRGMNIALHYRASAAAAEALCAELNARRPASAFALQADLHDHHALAPLIDQAAAHWGRLDVLINNASSFFPTPVGSITLAHWNDLIGSNLQAPLFLAQAAAPYLRHTEGCIINIVDIHAERPLKEHPVYSIAKAGLVMLTKALACELGPQIRVNGIAPGAILWPKDELDDLAKQRIINRTFLKRQGRPEDIAKAALFLIAEADYTSGHILSVDGGRALNS